MKGNRRILWTLLMIGLALAVTVCPLAAHIAQAEADARQVEQIEERVASLGDAQLTKYRNLAKWYNHQMELGNRGLRGLYSTILNLGEGRMGVLGAPELGLRLPIFHGFTGGVGHDPDTPLPIGGRGNHTVLVLAEVYPWSAGQVVYIDILGERLIYQVESVQVMPAGWGTERPASEGQELLSLVQDNRNTRTIIRCVRCANLTVRQMDTPEPGRILLAALLPLVLVLPAVGWRRRCAKCDHSPRICGFYRKKPEKSNLF